MPRMSKACLQARANLKKAQIAYIAQKNKAAAMALKYKATGKPPLAKIEAERRKAKAIKSRVNRYKAEVRRKCA